MRMGFFQSTRFLTLLLVVGIVAGSASRVEASLILRLTSGLSTVTILDNGVGDSDPTVGAIFFSGAVGSYAINRVTGLSSPVVGDAGTAQLSLTSLDLRDAFGTAGLTVELTDTGYTQAIGSPGDLSYSWGGTLTVGDTIIGQGYKAASNVAFATSSITTGLLGPFTGAFSTSGTVGHAALVNPYSMTIRLDIAGSNFVLLSQNSFNLMNTAAAVPEPGSLLLLGTGLLGIGTFARRRFRKKTQDQPEALA